MVCGSLASQVAPSLVGMYWHLWAHLAVLSWGAAGRVSPGPGTVPACGCVLVYLLTADSSVCDRTGLGLRLPRLSSGLAQE